MSVMAVSGDDSGYTYRDYLSWPDEERWELIDGVAYCMSPAPAPRHQEHLVELVSQFAAHLRRKPCRVYVAPFDVRLPDGDEADEKIRTVVQPDLVVICDATKIDERGCRGAPDLAIEILSPSTGSKDQVQKLGLYERHGVREYWVVDPGTRVTRVYLLRDDGRYGRDVAYPAGAAVPVATLQGLVIDTGLVFGEPPDKARSAGRTVPPGRAEPAAPSR
jgi:Uma2 family endonuclease